MNDSTQNSAQIAADLRKKAEEMLLEAQKLTKAADILDDPPNPKKPPAKYLAPKRRSK